MPIKLGPPDGKRGLITLAKLESGFDDVGFDAFKPERIRKENSESHVAELEKTFSPVNWKIW